MVSGFDFGVVSGECFRVELERILMRLGCSNASRLEPFRSRDSARVGQNWAAPGCLRYAAVERLDLLYLSIDFALVALISGALVAGLLVAW